jgi:hypothetical protein
MTDDPLDRQVQVSEGFGTSVQRTTSMFYDAAGRVFWVADRAGDITSYAYYALLSSPKSLGWNKVKLMHQILATGLLAYPVEREGPGSQSAQSWVGF